MEKIQKDIARKFIQLKAFSIQTQNPFVWGNGWQAPVYLDDRKILSYPPVRNFFRLELARVIAENFPDTDTIASVATNAIAYGLLAADQLALPFVSVYPVPKDHGKENQIEGDLRPRQNIVVMEDQVNEGDRLMRVVEAVQNNGCKVLGAVTLFDYEFPRAQERLKAAGIPLVALTNYSAVYQQLCDSKVYSDDVLESLKKWHSDPRKWHKE